MNQSLSLTLKSFGLSISAFLCYLGVREYLNNKKQLQEFKKTQIKDLTKINQMKQGQTRYLRLKLRNDERNKKNIRKQSINIHYNQFYVEQPSDIKILEYLKNRQIYQPIFDKCMWNFVDGSGNKMEFYNIQQIVGDVYDVKSQYRENGVGLFKRIWGGICYVFQSVFDIVRKNNFYDITRSSVPYSRGPVILGPVIGVLHYSIGLLTDTYFILKVQFQNGFHQAKILAQSKNALLGHYQTQINFQKGGIFIFSAIALMLGYSLYKDIIKMSSFRIVMKHIERGNKKWLTVENVDQDKACIICYSNCRNLLLFNCKHLIMCWDCWKLMKHKNCPICKVDISTAKVIYSEEQ